MHVVRATFFLLLSGGKWRLCDATITMSDAIYTTNFGAQTSKKLKCILDILENELFSSYSAIFSSKTKIVEIVWEGGNVYCTVRLYWYLHELT